MPLGAQVPPGHARGERREGDLWVPTQQELTMGRMVLACKGQEWLKSSMVPNMTQSRAQKNGTSTSACPHQYAEGKSPASRSWARAFTYDSKGEKEGSSAGPQTLFLLLLLLLHRPHSSLPQRSLPLPSRHFQFLAQLLLKKHIALNKKKNKNLLPPKSSLINTQVVLSTRWLPEMQANIFGYNAVFE